MSREHWPAPAKLNLFLHITGRRDDGYHTLQTVFQLLDYGDELRFVLRDDNKICLQTPLSGVPAGQDLTVQAARCLQQACQVRQGVDIHMRKRIPLGGGLGGGSSDAATTLIALNTLWACGQDRDRLGRLALTLGADVPVFVFGRSAWAEGVGEQLQALELAPRWYLVVVPPATVSTAEVFQGLELTGQERAITIRDFLAGGLGNDLETIVRASVPAVDEAIRWLSQFGPARMTGTGAAVFLPVDDEAQGQKILSQRPQGFEGFVARGRNTHPLCE